MQSVQFGLRNSVILPVFDMCFHLPLEDAFDHLDACHLVGAWVFHLRNCNPRVISQFQRFSGEVILVADVLGVDYFADVHLFGAGLA